MTTLLQAVKEIVQVEDNLEDFGYNTNNLYRIYMDEYGNHFGFGQKQVTEYLQGLPSCFGFPFFNAEILADLEGFGIIRKTEKGQDNLIEQYWQTLGYVVYRMLEKEKQKL